MSLAALASPASGSSVSQFEARYDSIVAGVVVRLLGPVTIEGETDTRRLVGRQADTLALLASQLDRYWSRDQLLTDLWGDEPTPSAATALRVHLSGIRKAFEAAGMSPPIERRPQGWRLTLEPGDVDIHRLERLVDELSTQAVRDPWTTMGELPAIASLTSTDALGGCNAAPGLEPLRHRIAVLVDRANDLTCDVLTRTGAAAGLEPSLRERHAADPCDERVATWLVRVLHATDRHAAAVNVVDETLDAIADRGLLPSETFEATRVALLNHDVAGLGIDTRLPDGSAVRRDARRSLVGREGELATLDDALARTIEWGSPSIVIIEGDAGIGKTALLEAWADGLPGSILTLEGRSSPDGQPFGAAIQALPGAADLGRGVDGGDLDRARFFEAAASLGSEQDATVLILDDAHWIDGGSSALIEHVVEANSDSPVLVVFACRPGVAAIVDEFVQRQGRRLPVETVRLEGLDIAEMRTLVRTIAGDELDRDVLEIVAGRAEGQPLFGVELAMSLIATPDVVPSIAPSASAFVAERLRHLDDDDRSIIETLALLGGSAQLHELVAISGRDLLDVARAVTTATRARLVSDRGPIRVHHPMFTEALLAAAGPTRSAAMAAHVAEALETLDHPGSLRAARLALLAGPLFRDDAAALVAKSARAAVFGLAFEDALALLDALPAEPAPSAAVQSMLDAARGLALSGLGRAEEADRHLTMAMDAALTSGVAEAIAIAAQARHLFGHRAQGHELGKTLVTEVIPALSADGPTMLLLETLWAASFEHVDDHGVVSELEAFADDVADALDSPRAEAIRAQMGVYTSVSADGDLDACGRWIDRGLEASRRCADATLEGLLLASAQRLALARGDLDEVERLADIQLGLTELQLGQTRSVVMARQAAVLLCRDHLDEAAAMMDEARALGRRAGRYDTDLVYLVQQFGLHLVRGSVGALADLPPIESDPAMSLGIAIARAAAGRRDEAIAILDSIDAERGSGLFALVEAALMVELCRALEQPVPETTLTRLDRRADEHVVVGVSGFLSLGPARRYLGVARALGGDADGARDALRHVVDACGATGHRLWARLARRDERLLLR